MKHLISQDVARSIASLITSTPDPHYLGDLVENANEMFEIEGGLVFQEVGEQRSYDAGVVLA